jgi:hypothetical protein
MAAGASAYGPVPGRLEVAEFAHQLGPQRTERAAPGDRIPPAQPANTPPGPAPAGGDLSPPASPKRAPAKHPPYRRNRLIRPGPSTRPIENTHDGARAYPARAGTARQRDLPGSTRLGWASLPAWDWRRWQAGLAWRPPRSCVRPVAASRLAAGQGRTSERLDECGRGAGDGEQGSLAACAGPLIVEPVQQPGDGPGVAAVAESAADIPKEAGQHDAGVGGLPGAGVDSGPGNPARAAAARPAWTHQASATATGVPRRASA